MLSVKNEVSFASEYVNFVFFTKPKPVYQRLTSFANYELSESARSFVKERKRSADCASMTKFQCSIVGL